MLLLHGASPEVVATLCIESNLFEDTLIYLVSTVHFLSAI